MVAKRRDNGSLSQALYERAVKVLPGGVSRNTVLRRPHPQYVDFASGCRTTDVDGVVRLDFANNMASLIHGHAHPAVVPAVAEQLARGTAYAAATEIEVRYAEALCARNRSFQKLRFVNSGTEAVMCALKAARAFTGRPKIAKVEGAYHGQYDYAEVSEAATPERWGSTDNPASVPVARGTPPAALADVVVIPFNDTERALAILADHGRDLACVLLDLMPHRVGLIPADAAFVEALRAWTEANGALLVFDEVITFRAEVAGLQAHYGIAPDLTALGKIIGGGFPVGAVAGRADVMEVMNPLADKVLFPHSGTFSANPVTMTAGLATMSLYDEAAAARLNELGRRAVAGIEAAIRVTGATACTTGYGSIFRVHPKATPPRNYRETYPTPAEEAARRWLVDALYEQGVVVFDPCTVTLSTPMGEAEVDALVDAFEIAFGRLAGQRARTTRKDQGGNSR